MQCKTARLRWTNEYENPSGLGRSGQLTRLPLDTWTGLPLEGWGLQGLAREYEGISPTETALFRAGWRIRASQTLLLRRRGKERWSGS